MNTTLDSEQTALHRSVVATPFDATPRMVLADWWQEHGRDDVAAMWRGQIPRIGTRDRIDAMTEAERGQMAAWAQRWIATGLSTEPADRPMFEAAVTQCYLAARLDPPRVVWCPNPLVAVAAGVIYTRGSQRGVVGGSAVDEAVREAVREAVSGAVRSAVGDAVDGAVSGAVRDVVDGVVSGAVDGVVGEAIDGAVHGAVRDTVRGAVRDTVDGAVSGAVDGAVRDVVDGVVSGAVDGAVYGAVSGAVDGAVRGAVRGVVSGAVHEAVRGAVGGAVDGAVHEAVRGAVRDVVDGAVGDLWYRYLGGQFWVGGYYRGSPSYVSFLLEVLRLRLPEHLELAARAYAATASSACWWWPHRDVVFVSERPHVLDLKPPTVQWEGWGIGQEVQDTNQTLAR